MPLAEDGQFVGRVQPGLINDEQVLLNYMSRWLLMTPQEIKRLYTLSWAQPDFFMPITTITKPQHDAAPPGLQGVLADGMLTESSDRRVYPKGRSHRSWWAMSIPPPTMGWPAWKRLWIPPWPGRMACLLVMNRAHTMTAQRPSPRAPPIPGKGCAADHRPRHTTGGGARAGHPPGCGSGDRSRHRAVLALASSPGYDPNRFEIGATATRGIGPIRSMFPRATLGTYPIGSIFKIVTMAAALEKGGYRADTSIDGPGIWYGLGKSSPP